MPDKINKLPEALFKIYEGFLKNNGFLWVVGKGQLCYDLDRPEVQKIILEIKQGPIRGLAKTSNVYAVILFRVKRDKTNFVKLPKEKPLFSFVGHGTEGFLLGWLPLKLGTLASGDRRNKIYIWHMSEGGQWVVDQMSLNKHEASVEDVQWSATEETLLVSCSVDCSIRFWDTHARPADACVLTMANAHDKGVNMLSWNKFDSLLVTGSDDTFLKVWSLKTIQYNKPVARLSTTMDL